HQAKDFRRAAIAVLDRVRARYDRASHAFGGGGVDRYGSARIVRGLDCGGHLGLAESRTAWLASAPAIIAIKLHDIRPRRDLAAYRSDHALDAAGFLRTQ